MSERATRWRSNASAAINNAALDATRRPQVDCGPDLHENTKAAETVLVALKGPSVYTRARSLVVVAREGAKRLKGVKREPGAPFVHELPPAAVREQLARGATWRSKDKKGNWRECYPPMPVVAALVARGEWPDVMPLAGIVESPTLRPDGSILRAPGYDEATALVYDPRGVEFPSVPDRPTKEEIDAAVALLWDPFEQFEWENVDVDRAVVLAAMLSFAGRPAFEGASPCFAFDSTTPGSGKGFGCAAVSLAMTGRRAAVSVLSTEAEEQRKNLFTLAYEGHRAILFDNLKRPLGGEVLSAAITAGEIRDRVLGVTESACAPFHAVLFATGNNLRFVDDFHRRVLVARQAPSVENPEERVPKGGWRHPDLLGYVQGEHPRLLAAALAILRGYHVASRPSHGRPAMGSFESWDALVRGACVWCGVGDPLACQERIREGADEDRERIAGLLTAWRAWFGDENATVSEAVVDAWAKPVDGRSDQETAEREALRASLVAFDGKGTPDRPNPTSIGSRVAGVVGRPVVGQKLERVGKTSPARYRVVAAIALAMSSEDAAQAAWSVGSVGSVGSDTPNTCTRARAGVMRGGGTNPTNPTNPTRSASGEADCFEEEGLERDAIQGENS